jgi:two-component system LytT family response regulator
MEPIKVLIIDDEPDAVISIELIIKEFCPSLQVVGKANIIDHAWDQIKELKPDLVFLDVDMPRGNGFDLLERFPIRKFDVIFVTAYSRYQDKARAYSAFGYIHKPIDIDEFQELVQKLGAYRKSNPQVQYKLEM